MVPVFRLYLLLKPWGMLEIFMLVIIVSGFKLIKMASLIPGLSLFAFFGLVFVLALIIVTLDEHLIWERVDFS